MFNRHQLWGNLMLVLASTAVYGAVLAYWRSPLMALYVSVKLPLVFVMTTLLVSVLCWTSATLLGSDLGYGNVLDAVFSAMATAGRMFLALAPIVLYFIVTAADDKGTPEQLRQIHASLMLVHLTVFASAGTAGVVMMFRSLHEHLPSVGRLVLMIFIWLFSFAVVGGQIGWILRPLVGSPNISVEFVRKDAFASNVIESLVGQIIPNLINKGVRR